MITEAINGADDRFATKDDEVLLESRIRRQFVGARRYGDEGFTALMVEMAELRGELEALRREVRALTWLAGLNMAMTTAVLFRLFFAFP